MTDEKTTPAPGTRRRRRGYYPGPAAGVTADTVPRAAKPGRRPDAHPRPPASAGAPPPTVAEDGESLTADRVEVIRAAVGRVDAGELSVHQGAIGAARAGRIDIQLGAIGAALADDIDVERGYVRTVLAREVELEQAFAQAVIAGKVEARQSIIGFLIARRIEGDVKVLFDWRGALAFGAVAGIVGGLLARTRGRRDRT